jgi:ElaB/YqjD/DUF883 family membrane-anchored ribosome-binding protein
LIQFFNDRNKSMKSEITTTAQDLQSTREKMAENLSAAAGGAARFVKDLSARSLHDAGEMLSDARSATAAGTEEVAGMASAFVRAHPMKALGIAAAIGLLLGVFASRRSP